MVLRRNVVKGVSVMGLGILIVHVLRENAFETDCHVSLYVTLNRFLNTLRHFLFPASLHQLQINL